MRNQVSLACFLAVVGVRAANAQCYQFSSGTAASLTINITNLPAPSSAGSGNYDYLFFGVSGNSANLTSGQTSYPTTLFDINSNFSALTNSTTLLISTVQASTSSPSVTVKLTGPGNLLPAGLPSVLPLISAWTSNVFQAIFPSTIAPPSGPTQLYTLTSVTSCSSPSPPSIFSGGIVPVSSSASIIQPGEWVSIYGTNLASSTATWTGSFPTSLGGTSVAINSKAAYISFASPGQINVQAPSDTAAGPVPVVVTTANGSATSTVTLAPFAPSLLLLDTKHVAGIILRSNGSGAYGGGAYDIIGPTGTSLGYSTVAARAGDTIELFGTGFGPTNPPVPAGQAFSGAAPTTSPVTLLINNLSVPLSFAGLSGAGLYQLNLTVSSGLGTGDVSLQSSVGGVQTPSGVVISLQ